jgi:aminoglycoside phosphotransferase (APT) family kinase protein
MTHTADAGNEAVLAVFGLRSRDGAFLGRGGEATTYALDGDRVLRLLHEGAEIDKVYRNRLLLQELTPAVVPFRLPEILEVGQLDGRVYAVERRLQGRSLEDLLKTIEGPERDHLIESHLEAARALGDLRAEPWPFFGELATARPVRADTWREFLTMRAVKSLAGAGDQFDEVDAEGLVSDLPEPERCEFVHLDAFAGNMLSDGVQITAVLDFGPTCVAGDRRFDPIATAAYLDPGHFPFATARDREVARSWLTSVGLLDLFEPVRRWLAGYWAFAVDDAPLRAWCRSVLLG